VVGRLVHEQQVGRPQQQPQHGQPALLPAAQHAHRLLDLLAAEEERAQQVAQQAGLKIQILDDQQLAEMGAGAILVGMILAAIAAYVIDRNWKGAIGYSLFGAACAWVGFIHSTELRLVPSVGPAGFNASWGPIIGYLAMAVLFLVMMLYKPKAAEEAPPAEEAAGAAD